MINSLRRFTQLAAWLLLLYIPAAGLVGIHFVTRGYDIPMENVTWLSHRLYDYFHDMDDPVTSIYLVKGSMWSMSIGKLTISDPLAVLESFISTKKYFNPFFITALLPIFLTALLGRVYCGWLCPMNPVFEVNHWLRRKLISLGLRFPNVSFARNNKYYVLIGGLICSLVAGMSVFPLFYPPANVSRIVFMKIFYSAFGFGFGIVMLMLLMEFFVAPRAWCRSFCPGGALYSLLSPRRLLRVKVDGVTCDNCGDCFSSCEFGLNPVKAASSKECDNCGKCIPACGKHSLKYGVGTGGASNG